MGTTCSALRGGEYHKTNNISNVTTYDLKLIKSSGLDVSALNARLIGNGATNIACLHTQQGKKGINQDAMIAWEVQYLIYCLFLFHVMCFRVTFFVICLFPRDNGMRKEFDKIYVCEEK